jgi:hypothetical protein
MTEDEVIDRLSADFRDDLCVQLKFVKLCRKGDLDGDDDGFLWHFTRFTNLQKMLTKHEVWLCDLAYSNDENEVVYGISFVNAALDELTRNWPNEEHVKIVRRLAERLSKRPSDRFHVYAFSLSTERDTVQHWNGYGGGLHVRPDPRDPHVAIGFDATALFHPIELSSERQPIYAINTVSGDDAAKALARYWAIKTRKALEVLDAPIVPLEAERVYDLCEHMLVLACSLVKNLGWKDENEYRLLYVANDFGNEHEWLPKKPNGQGRYVPLRWDEGRSPIRTFVSHPLADNTFVETSWRAISGASDIIVEKSELKPRPR